MGFTGDSVPPLLVYNGSRLVTIGGTSGVVLNGVWGLSPSTIWDGQSAWFDNNGSPRFYWAVNRSSPINYGEMNFSVPISSFAAKINAKPDDLSYARIEAFDAQGNRVGCVDNIVNTIGTNSLVYRGISSSTPMARLVIYGFVVLDNIEFTEPACLPDSCDVNAWCFNDIANNPSCACKSGYDGDGTVGNCVDKNECNDSPCATHASCTNLPGSYNCTCNAGYEGDGFKSCVDINECTAGVCSPNATCVNYEPGVNCTCLEGYTGDGFTCTDVNECLDQPCDPNASCTNTAGSYSCACNVNYSGDGKTCTKTASTKQVSSASPMSGALVSIIVALFVMLVL